MEVERAEQHTITITIITAHILTIEPATTIAEIRCKARRTRISVDIVVGVDVGVGIGSGRGRGRGRGRGGGGGVGLGTAPSLRHGDQTKPNG